MANNTTIEQARNGASAMRKIQKAIGISAFRDG